MPKILQANIFRRYRILETLSQPTRLSAKLEQLYCSLVTLLLPPAFRERNIGFAPVGKRYTWIYGSHLLLKSLEQAGFVSIRKLRFVQTKINELLLYPFDAIREDIAGKGQGSTYVEAKKP